MAGGQTLPTERVVQRSILAMARACFPDVLLHHSPNGAHLAGTGTARFKQAGALLGDGMRKGFPDLVAIWTGGLAFIEVKRPKTGRLSEDQVAMHAAILERRWPIATVTTPQEAHAFLKQCGAPCKGELM